jgi:hypothetical protein
VIKNELNACLNEMKPCRAPLALEVETIPKAIITNSKIIPYHHFVNNSRLTVYAIIVAADRIKPR